MHTLFTALILCSPPSDWHVDVHAPNCATGNGTSTAPFCAIGDALLVAAAGDRVLVAPGTYVERLVVPAGVTVLGTAGADRTVVDGQGLGPTVRTGAGATVVLEGLTITGGVGTANPGGIAVHGALELRGVAVVDNRATGAAGGIGLSSSATNLTLVGCRVERNTSNGAGGLEVPLAGMVVVAEDTTFLQNDGGFEGGAILDFGGALTLRRCAIAENTAAVSGGGVLGFGPLVIESCTFEANSATAFGAGLEWLGGSAQLTNSTFSGNTILGNFGGGGGALLQNLSAATARVEHCTFTGNTGWNGGGLLIASGGPATGATIVSSALVGNFTGPGGQGADLYGGIASGGHNLFGDVAFATLAPTDQSNVPAEFAPLRHNGGATRTHLPLPASAAVDGAAPGSPLITDQRGAVRVPGSADVGATELIGRTVGCAVVPSSNGAPVYLAANGDDGAASNALTLVAGDLPPGRFGYFLSGTLVGSMPNPGGSLGVQCVAGAVGRLNRSALGEVRSSDARGVIEVTLDLTQLATPTGAESVMAGDTRVFQLWYRDGVSGPSSNFSEALEVTFR